MLQSLLFFGGFCLVVTLLIWGFWTAPHIRKKKRNTAPWWAWLLLIPYAYDIALAWRMRRRSSPLSAALIIQTITLILFLFSVAAGLALYVTEKGTTP